MGIKRKGVKASERDIKERGDGNMTSLLNSFNSGDQSSFFLKTLPFSNNEDVGLFNHMTKPKEAPRVASGPWTRSEGQSIARWEDLKGEDLRNELKTIRGGYPKTDFGKYKEDKSNIKFADRTYFGSNDYLPESMMDDIIKTSKQYGMDPMDSLIVAGMESRFEDKLIESNEPNMMRMKGTSMEEVSTKSFEAWILQRGYHSDSKYVSTRPEGLFLEPEWYDSVSDQQLKNYKKSYDSYSQTKGDEDSPPFHSFVSYLKKYGVQGYNSEEFEGNEAYGGEFEFTKDRMKRYNEVREILTNEPQFMEAFNKYNK